MEKKSRKERTEKSKVRFGEREITKKQQEARGTRGTSLKKKKENKCPDGAEQEIKVAGGQKEKRSRHNRGPMKSDSTSKNGVIIAEGGQTERLPFPFPSYT